MVSTFLDTARKLGYWRNPDPQMPPGISVVPDPRKITAALLESSH